MAKMFLVREDASLQNWMVAFNVDELPEGIMISGSYNVIAAHLLGFSYANYLRFCRAHGATLRGKKGYSTAGFQNKADAEYIAKLCNDAWDAVYQNLK